jgi:hypothetical protein
MDRAEATRREHETWEPFAAALAEVPAHLRDRPVLRDGWSPTDVAWHVASWIDRQAGIFERIADGTWQPEPLDIDAMNAGLLEQSRSISWDDATSKLESARERILAAWGALPSIDDDVLQRFAGDTYEHYEEHLPDLRPAAGAVDEPA